MNSLNTGANAAEALCIKIPHLFIILSDVVTMVTELVLGNGKLDQPAGSLRSVSFAFACGTFAVLFVMLDICVKFIRNKSFLQLKYESYRWVGLIFAMPLAAAIVGFLGVGLDVLEVTRSACITVGIGWSFLLAALFNVSDGIDPATEDTESGGEPL